MVATALAAAALAVTATGSFISYRGQKKASKRAEEERRKQRNLQEKQQEVEQQRRVRQNVRQARKARAAALANAVQQGVNIDSSSVRGGTSSIQSQLGSNLGYIQQSGARASAIGQSIFDQKSAIAQGNRKAALGGTISSVGASVFDAAGGFDTLASADVFGGSTSPNLATGVSSNGTKTIGRFNVGGAGVA